MSSRQAMMFSRRSSSVRPSASIARARSCKQSQNSLGGVVTALAIDYAPGRRNINRLARQFDAIRDRLSRWPHAVGECPHLEKRHERRLKRHQLLGYLPCRQQTTAGEKNLPFAVAAPFASRTHRGLKCIRQADESPFCDRTAGSNPTGCGKSAE